MKIGMSNWLNVAEIPCKFRCDPMSGKGGAGEQSEPPLPFSSNIPGGHFKSCRFITVMRARLKVPAKNCAPIKNEPTIAAFPLLRKSRAGEFLAGTFKRARMTVMKRQDLK